MIEPIGKSFFSFESPLSEVKRELEIYASTLTSLESHFSDTNKNLKELREALEGQGPEILFDSMSLSRNDPFRKVVFDESNESERVFRSQGAYSSYQKLFSKLGSWSPWFCMANKNTLFALETEVTKHRETLNPIEVLYFLFHDRTRCEQIVGFYKMSHSKAFKALLPMVNRENPWEEFLEKNATFISNHWNIVLPLLPGFCQGMGLPHDSFRKKLYSQPKEAILDLFHHRNKQFNLSLV